MLLYFTVLLLLCTVCIISSTNEVRMHSGSECTNYTTTVYYSQLVVIALCLFDWHYSNLCTNNGVDRIVLVLLLSFIVLCITTVCWRYRVIMYSKLLLSLF